MEGNYALLVFFLRWTIYSGVFASGEDSTSRSGYFITRENKRLTGHVIKLFESQSFLSCSQSCLKNVWCSSTNFKASFKKDGKGTCELNKHDSSLINENTKLNEQQGFVFSMFRKGCLMTGCANGGSCVSNKEKQTYSCVCKKPWTGDVCEVKMDIDKCASQPCKNNATCTDRVDGYNCSCVPGFNGTQCELNVGMPSVKAYRMIFPRKSVEDYAIKGNAVGSNLTAFTLCSFVKLNYNRQPGGQCLYTYATPGDDDDAIYLCLTKLNLNITPKIGRVRVGTNVRLEQYRWHHICFTWENTQGMWQLYKNGQLAGNGKGMATNYVILSGGTAVIGQDQDGGGFSKREVFGPGEIRELNLWDSVLSASDIASLNVNVTLATGLVHSWAQFKDGVHGDVRVEEP